MAKPPPHHISYLVGYSLVSSVDQSLQQREATQKILQFYLKQTQNRMKK